jgi:hypothetical protein
VIRLRLFFTTAASQYYQKNKFIGFLWYFGIRGFAPCGPGEFGSVVDFGTYTTGECLLLPTVEVLRVQAIVPVQKPQESPRF